MASLEAIKSNLFPGSHAAISDWSEFPWHRHRGEIQAYKPESSQALAIDVFGTISASPVRDKILAALARKCRLPEDGPWRLELEWSDPQNLLNEPRPTQVDAIAFGRKSILVIECKFTESGGSCSQPKSRQCNGSYVLQANPATNRTARCALTAKGIRYWQAIPKIYNLDADQDYNPCPFAGEAYQWMRNLVLAHALAAARGIPAAVIAAYADAPQFVTAREVHIGTLGAATAAGLAQITPISYQTIVSVAQSCSEHAEIWQQLAVWVQRKLDIVSGAPRFRREATESKSGC